MVKAMPSKRRESAPELPERIGFGAAYLIAASAVIAQIVLYCHRALGGIRGRALALSAIMPVTRRIGGDALGGRASASADWHAGKRIFIPCR